MWMITQEGGYSLAILGFFSTEEEAREWWINIGKDTYADKDGYHQYDLYDISLPCTILKEDERALIGDHGLDAGFIPYRECTTLRGR